MKIEFNSASESPALTGKIDIKEKQEKKNKNKQKQKERAKTKTKRQVADDSKVVNMSELIKEKFIMKGKLNEKRNPYQKIPSPLQSSLACLDVTRHVIIV